VSATRRTVVVVGSGLAGLTAALQAVQDDARVVLVEAADEPGGSLAISGGLIWAPRSHADAGTLVPRGATKLLDVLVDDLEPLWTWLEQLGVALHPEAPCLKELPSGGRVGRGRMMVAGRAGDRREVVSTLVERLRALDGEIRLSSPIESLERAPGGWSVGCTGSAPIHAGAVVFAAGGFHNSLDLLRQYVTPWPEGLVVRSNNRHSDGIGLRLLIPLGARMTRGMHSFYGHSLPYAPGRDWRNTDDFLTGTMYYTDYSVLVNQIGLRFKDETVGCLDELNAQHGSRQPLGRYYMVFDERIRRTFVDADLVGMAGLASARTSARIDDLRALGADVVEEPTLDDLAKAMGDRFGIPAVNVLSSLLAYNQTEDPVALEPARRRHHLPLTEPPYRAVRCVPGITFTMGGLEVEPDLHVVGPGLEGIFAAGSDAGGVFEDIYAGGHGWAGVSGRRAGAGAARSAGTT
jgi:FAD binding domain